MFRQGMAICAVLAFASVVFADIEIDLRPASPGPYAPGEVVNVEAYFVDLDNGHPITGEDILFRGYQLDFTATDSVLGLPAQMNLENPSGLNILFPDLPRPVLIWPLPNEIPAVMMTLPAGGEMLVGNLDVTVNETGWLDVMNPVDNDNLGAWVVFGFGVDPDDPIITWRAFTGELTGGRLKMEIEGPPPPCPADFDDSGDVGVKDLLFLLGTWGPCPKKGDCLADFDDTGAVGVKDLLLLLGAWGPCP